MVKKGEFIKIEYTAYDENGNVFDSTKGDIAKSLHGKEGALLVVFEYDRLVPGLEEGLQNMKKGEKKELHLLPEHAFGNRNKNMIRIMSQFDFLRNDITPVPGLSVHVDTEHGRQFGVIKSSSGGRVLVDFNHPLAGKKVKYIIELIDVITDPVQKVESILADASILGKVKLEKDDVKIELKGQKDMNEINKYLETVIPRVIDGIKKVEIIEVN